MASPLPHDGPQCVPIPVRAVFGSVTKNWRVEFSGPLTERLLDVSNWFIRHNRRIYVPGFARAIGSVVQGPSAHLGFTGPGSLVDYFATPPDLLSAIGAPVLPFANFPLEVF